MWGSYDGPLPRCLAQACPRHTSPAYHCHAPTDPSLGSQPVAAGGCQRDFQPLHATLGIGLRNPCAPVGEVDAPRRHPEGAVVLRGRGHPSGSWRSWCSRDGRVERAAFLATFPDWVLGFSSPHVCLEVVTKEPKRAPVLEDFPCEPLQASTYMIHSFAEQLRNSVCAGHKL